MKAITEKESGTISDQYSFQAKAAQKIAQDCEDSRFIGAVLAGSVGCGKTQILIHALNLITKKHPSSKILYLAHAQDSIRQQTIDTFVDTNNPVKPEFTFGRLNSGCQVEIAIPQEFHRCSPLNRYSHAVIDEAHQWFASTSVLENVIRKYEIKKLILASGTISMFNRYNATTSGKQFAMTFISGDQMLKRGIFSALDIDLVGVPSYQSTKHILAKIWKDARSKGDQLARPIVVCQNTSEAIEVSETLRAFGYAVALAASATDPDGVQIQRFKNDEATALVLVNRGILGLNLKNATSMVFLKKTENFESILQAMARMFRNHPSGQKKYFWMPATTEDWNRKVTLLHQTLSLINLDVMKSYVD